MQDEKFAELTEDDKKRIQKVLAYWFDENNNKGGINYNSS